MQMGVGGERHREPPPRSSSVHPAKVAAHINNQRPPITQIDQVGRIAQALIDQRNRLDSSHVIVPFNASTASSLPMFYTIPKMIGEWYG